MEGSKVAEIRRGFKRLFSDILVLILLVIGLFYTSIHDISVFFLSIVLIIISMIAVGYGSFLLFRVAVLIKDWVPRHWINRREMLPIKHIEYSTYCYIIFGFIMIFIINPDWGSILYLGGFNLSYIAVPAPFIIVVWFMHNKIFPQYFNSYWKCFRTNPEKARDRLKNHLRKTGFTFKENFTLFKKFKFLTQPLKFNDFYVSIRFQKIKKDAKIIVIFRASEEEKARKLMEKIDETLDEN